jgi:hypothetical protein
MTNYRLVANNRTDSWDKVENATTTAPANPRVPTEQDVAFAQQVYEVCDQLWLDLMAEQCPPGQYWTFRGSAQAHGRLGTELRRAWQAREQAQDHYLAVWNDYLGGKQRSFP